MFKPGTSGTVNDMTRYIPKIPLQVYNLQASSKRTGVRMTPKDFDVFLMSLSKEYEN